MLLYLYQVYIELNNVNFNIKYLHLGYKNYFIISDHLELNNTKIIIYTTCRF